MPADVTRSELQQLEARVSVVEGEVEGEKLVTRHILEQTRRNGDDLAAIKGRLNRVESDISGLKADVGELKAGLRGLRQELPAIVAASMREVLRERDGP